MVAVADAVPEFDDVDRTVPLVHGETTLGYITVVKPRGETLSSSDERLLLEVAAHTALLVRAEGTSGVPEQLALARRLIAADEPARAVAVIDALIARGD